MITAKMRRTGHSSYSITRDKRGAPEVADSGGPPTTGRWAGGASPPLVHTMPPSVVGYTRIWRYLNVFLHHITNYKLQQSLLQCLLQNCTATLYNKKLGLNNSQNNSININLKIPYKIHSCRLHNVGLDE